MKSSRCMKKLAGWKIRLIPNFSNIKWPQAFKKTSGHLFIEQWIIRFDAEKKTVTCGQVEIARIEDRVREPWQPIEEQHASYCRQGSPQHPELKADEQEGGPAIGRPATDIERIVD